MTPTEHETQVAMEAAAKAIYDREVRAYVARTPEITEDNVQTWEEAAQAVRNEYLDEVTVAVWAALQALPDRALQIKHLIRETDFRDTRQIAHFLEVV